MTQKESIIEVLKCVETKTLISIWNEYCSEKNMDDYIYSNDEYFFNEMFEKADDAVRAVCFGSYEYTDEYVIFNAYGNLVSFDIYDAEQHIDFDTLADYIMENDCREIQEVWLEDVSANFVEYFNEKFEDIEIDDYYDLSSYNLLTEDWDDIAEDILENIKEENNEE